MGLKEKLPAVSTDGHRVLELFSINEFDSKLEDELLIRRCYAVIFAAPPQRSNTDMFLKLASGVSRCGIGPLPTFILFETSLERRDAAAAFASMGTMLGDEK